MTKPEYKIGDVVIYKGMFGYIQQGIVRAANYFTDEDYYGEGWRYYVSSRPDSWRVKEKKIISKA